jgi:plastocyanin
VSSDADTCTLVNICAYFFTVERSVINTSTCIINNMTQRVSADAKGDIPSPYRARRRDLTTLVSVVVVGLLAFTVVNLALASVSSGSTSKRSQTASVVALDIIPDWAGTGYDAFVLTSSINNTTPTPGNDTVPPGPANANFTVQHGVPVTFIINNLDTAQNENFTGTADHSFTYFEDTDSGVIAVNVSAGQVITDLPVGHSFTSPSMGINIPIPADTVVTFTYTFSKAGVYQFFCVVPCGPGMGVNGYMQGFIIVE